jgi:hypothetical protein
LAVDSELGTVPIGTGVTFPAGGVAAHAIMGPPGLTNSVLADVLPDPLAGVP